MTGYVALAAATFLFVALKSWQQLNVVHARYAAIVPTSFAMAVAEVTVVVGVVQHGLAAALPMGVGGAVGCCLSVWLHRRVFASARNTTPNAR